LLEEEREVNDKSLSFIAPHGDAYMPKAQADAYLKKAN